MSDKIIYNESQRFRQKYIWVLLIAVFLIASVPQIYILTQQIFYGKPYGNRPMSNEGVIVVTIISVVIPLLVMALFRVMRLETQIKEEGIYARYLPFQTKFKYYAWNDLIKCHVRQYNPIGEYGGWGLKGIGNNRALNISGNKGIQLETKDGKKMLIGTNNPEEVTRVLIQLGYWKE